MSNGEDAERWSETIKSVRDTVIPSVEKQLTALLLAQPQLLIDAKTNPEAFILVTRELLWADYQAIESRFYQVVLGHHPQWGIPFSVSSGGSAQQNESIAAYMAAGMPKLYELALSTTNSRRSRAGSEFKFIVCRLLEALEVPFVSEAQIGAQKERLDLGKNVDVLIPNPDQYLRDRTSCVLLSLKTSLRERWQQVAEEAQRTKAGLVSLLTLDDVGLSTWQTMQQSNIQLVVPETVKQSTFAKEDRVVSINEYFLSKLPTWVAAHGFSK